MKHKFILSMLILLLAAGGMDSAPDTGLTIPVRIRDSSHRHPRFHPFQVQLLINGTEREITGFEYRERSLDGRPELNRHVILSFQVQELKDSLKTRLSYIITEILHPGDRLILVSPLNIYRITVPPNKRELISRCDSLLNPDFLEHHQTRNNARKQLVNQIRKLKSIFHSPESFTGPYVGCINFLTLYPAEFKKYRNRYLIPDPQLFQKIRDMVFDAEGDKWWIHLHDHETYDIFFQTSDIISDINQYIINTPWQNQGLPKTITTKLSRLEQNLFLGETIPEKPVLDSLLKANISMNFLIFSQIAERLSHAHSVVITDLESIFRNISRASGGMILKATNPGQEVEQLKKHVDRFHEVEFRFNHIIEPKTISLMVKSPGPHTIDYPDTFSIGDLKMLVARHSRRKVSLGNITRNRNRLGFNIHHFQINPRDDKNKPYGLVKVMVSLTDSEEIIVYSSQKILRASDKSLDISLPLPDNLGGKHLLHIRVIDLLANRQISHTRMIDWDRP